MNLRVALALIAGLLATLVVFGVDRGDPSLVLAAAVLALAVAVGVSIGDRWGR